MQKVKKMTKNLFFNRIFKKFCKHMLFLTLIQKKSIIVNVCKDTWVTIVNAAHLDIMVILDNQEANVYLVTAMVFNFYFII